MWALIELGNRAWADPAIELRLETLDDIQFDEGGSPTELLQTKHHVGEASTLTTASVDLWRTLNVWMDLPADSDAILRLVTTSMVPENSDLAGLLKHTRNTKDVTVALTAAANSSGNKTTKAWRVKFLGLSDTQREELIEKIVIEDSSPRASDLDDQILITFRYAFTPNNATVFSSLLRGWWSGIAVRLLDRSLNSVTGNDLLNQISDIADQLRTDNLPVDPDALLPFGESDIEPYRTRTFVQQLAWIALDNTRLWKAIRDYHRSFTQRSYWLRHQLISETELDRFAFRLYDEWEQIFDTAVAEAQSNGCQDSEVVGQRIFAKIAQESRVRVRERFVESWFNRGMFHSLADGEVGEQIGWHPDFAMKLEALLSDVSV